VSKGRAYWESALPALHASLRTHAGRRLPHFPDRAEDLASDAIAGLVRWVRAHRDRVPASWLAAAQPPAEAVEELRKLAFAFLRRRMADAARGRARESALEQSPESAEGESRTEEPEREALLRRMVAVCARVLEGSEAEELELVAVSIGSERRSGAFDSAERKRLQRLRLRLSEAIRDELGASAAALLRGNDEA
jgi:hypothetical protein